ncbi:hypothetical protein PMAYCL1PPCAC_25260, partial [Pristionchus mayeri]
MKNTPPDGSIRIGIIKHRFRTHPESYCVSYNYSPVVEVKGIPWSGSVSLANNREIGTSIECQLVKTMKWSIDMDAEFILVNSDPSKNHVVQDSYNFRPGDYPVGKMKNCSTLITDDALIDPAKGFINGETFTIEIRFWITKMRGLRINQLTDFTDPNDP